MPWTKKWTVLVTICSVLVGVLLMFQLKAQARTDQSGQKEDLLQTAMQYDLENAQLKSDNKKLQEELNKYKQGVDAALLADQQLKRAKLIAGLTAVKGPGVRVTLTDSTKKIDEANQDLVALYIVHEGYLRKIINALWNANAEAIAVNGQRVTANTEIFCNGNNILVNREVQTPPYIIDAIGDPEALKAAMNLTYHAYFESYVTNFGLGFEMKQLNELQLPAGKIRPYSFSVPVKEVK